ncbi:MAG TPA: DUF427 domain-containing protein [Cytophagaceae bacterium]|jgi:uncharacterized protein (DUF427 family)
MKAIYNSKIVAESQDIEEINGNYCFPFDSINKSFLVASKTEKAGTIDLGEVAYYDLCIDDQIISDGVAILTNPKKDWLKGSVIFSNEIELKESQSFINSYLLNVLNSFF